MTRLQEADRNLRAANDELFRAQKEAEKIQHVIERLASAKARRDEAWEEYCSALKLKSRKTRMSFYDVELKRLYPQEEKMNG